MLLHAVGDIAEPGPQLGGEFGLPGFVGFDADGAGEVADDVVFGAHFSRISSDMGPPGRSPPRLSIWLQAGLPPPGRSRSLPPRFCFCP
jgi:hypothetical protein